jgi:hypothetical protein
MQPTDYAHFCSSVRRHFGHETDQLSEERQQKYFFKLGQASTTANQLNSTQQRGHSRT